MRYTVLTSMPDGDLAERWNAFLASARFATHYVTPNYFIDPYVRGSRFAVLAIDENDDVVAVMTGTRSHERIISGIFSRPQLAFRTKVDRRQSVSALASGLKELGADSALTEVYSWEPVEFDGHGMRVRQSSEDTSIVMLDLAKGADAIFAGFSEARRRTIRRLERHRTLEIKEPETYSEIEALYRIYCDWNERKGIRPDTFERMQTAIGQRENRRVLIAKADGKTIAGSFYRFCPGGVVEYAANYSLLEHQRLRPNDLLGWHAIQWAAANNFTHMSMGGAHLFLRRFGGEIITTYRYRRDASRFRLYELRENARDLGLGVYQRLPGYLRGGLRRMLAR